MTLGSLYRAQNNYAGAATEYEKVVKLEPKDALGHYNLGVAYVALKRPDDGIRELEEAMDLKPDDYETRVSLGKIYSKKADYKHAIEHLVKATELKPADVDAWNSLGIARSKTDDKEGAIVAFKKAIALRPEDAELHFGLATVYRRQRNTDERDRRVPGRGAEEPEAGQGLLRHGAPLLAGQEERRGARGVREVPAVRHQRGRGLAQGRRGTPEDVQEVACSARAPAPAPAPAPLAPAAHPPPLARAACLAS